MAPPAHMPRGPHPQPSQRACKHMSRPSLILGHKPSNFAHPKHCMQTRRSCSNVCHTRKMMTDFGAIRLVLCVLLTLPQV